MSGSETQDEFFTPDSCEIGLYENMSEVELNFSFTYTNTEKTIDAISFDAEFEFEDETTYTVHIEESGKSESIPEGDESITVFVSTYDSNTNLLQATNVTLSNFVCTYEE